ncbi:ATP-binding protein [Streptomyces sp. NPDC057245]|uniref:ATP-binding protein n=1 Tax=Streptomyces sp. NPDC057245 TaxID=3346065 RepID=UPI003641B030
MTSKPSGIPSPTPQVALRHHLIDNPGASTAATAHRAFEMRFSSTPRGARLARRLAACRLDDWGLPYGTDVHDTVVLIVAELTANAVVHGHVPGRDFHLALRLHADARTTTLRVEVTDTRAERVPPRPGAVAVDPAPDAAETGRGLLLVAGLATRWDWHPRPDGPGKTVWAVYEVECDAWLDQLADEGESEGGGGPVSLEEMSAIAGTGTPADSVER